jgi:hypothetical protein
MQDKTILEHINDLVEEEKRLRADATQLGENGERIKHIEEQLDQCWDLLRQRRARREFGDDPDGAKVRDVDTVEKYLQ